LLPLKQIFDFDFQPKKTSFVVFSRGQTADPLSRELRSDGTLPVWCQNQSILAIRGDASSSVVRSLLSISWTLSLFARLISHQPTILFSQNESATSRNPPAVLFSQNKPAPAISHQPTEQAACSNA
jgi:hypothetical protein